VKGPGRGPGHQATAPAAASAAGPAHEVDRLDRPDDEPVSDEVDELDRRRQPLLDLYGLAEVADLVGMQGHKERLRKYLPPADLELRMGPIWTGHTIRLWLREQDRRRKQWPANT
jgi:hypothetical protein